MKTLTTTPFESSVAKTVAPEDLRCGDFVAVLNVTYEFPSFLWCQDPQMLPASEPVRARFRSPNSGRPLKIKAVCLPYVFVKSPCRRCKTLDVRRCQLVRLHAEYANYVWKAIRKQQKTRKKKNSRF